MCTCVYVCVVRLLCMCVCVCMCVEHSYRRTCSLYGMRKKEKGKIPTCTQSLEQNSQPRALEKNIGGSFFVSVKRQGNGPVMS